MSDAENLAREFHERYERLAPDFGYETRKESAVPWEDVPEQNRALMVAVCEPLAARLGQAEEALRDHREILKAWSLGDSDKMAALMLGAFLREFGKAPDMAAGSVGVTDG